MTQASLPHVLRRLFQMNPELFTVEAQYKKPLIHQNCHTALNFARVDIVLCPSLQNQLEIFESLLNRTAWLLLLQIMSGHHYGRLLWAVRRNQIFPTNLRQ